MHQNLQTHCPCLPSVPPGTTLLGTSLRHHLITRLLLPAFILFLILLVVGHRIGQGEFNLNADESYHACTGMYVADFLRAFPITHPLKFTTLYYIHYPAMGMIHWPPFFYVAEGIAFLVAGPSVIAARVTVLLFVLFGSYYWFRLLLDMEGPYYAAAATLLLALLPFFLLYEKAVMLETPSLALCIAASYYWIRYLNAKLDRYVYAFAALASLALLTKQLTIYLALFCLLTVFCLKQLTLFSKPATWKALGLCVAMAAPYYCFVLKFHWKVIQYDMLKTKIPGNPFAFYLRVLPGQLGLPIVFLSLLGIATCWWWGKSQNNKLMLVWIAACYLTMTFFAEKEPRYIIYWLPPFIYFALGPWIALRPFPVFRYAGMAIVATLLTHSLLAAWIFERPYISGYDALAEALTERGNPGFLLFDADLPADFIFFVRKLDPRRHYVVLRKALYAEREMKRFGSMEFVHDTQDLDNLIDSYGIRFVVVDNSPPVYESQEVLRRYLQSPRFTLIKTVAIRTNIPGWKGRELSLYENLRPTPCSAQSVHIEMMSLPSNVDASTAELGLDCTPLANAIPKRGTP